MHVIDMSRDWRPAGRELLRRHCSVDRVELAEQAGITRVEHVRFACRRAVEQLR